MSNEKLIRMARDWQAIATREAAESLGTPEGAARLVEAKRYGLLADALATQRQAEPEDDGDYYSEEADDIEQSRARAEVTDAQRDAVARAICIACEEGPDFPGEASGNEFRWQDYRDVADAVIQAMQKDTK